MKSTSNKSKPRCRVMTSVQSVRDKRMLTKCENIVFVLDKDSFCHAVPFRLLSLLYKSKFRIESKDKMSEKFDVVSNSEAMVILLLCNIFCTTRYLIKIPRFFCEMMMMTLGRYNLEQVCYGLYTRSRPCDFVECYCDIL